MKNSHKDIIITGIISLVLITIAIIYLTFNKDSIFKWNDPTAEIRNVLLGLVAIGGIPFLILGHINRRNDIEEKRIDFRFKSESTIVGFIQTQLKNASDEFHSELSSEFDRKVGIDGCDKIHLESVLRSYLRMCNSEKAHTKKEEWQKHINNRGHWPRITKCLASVTQSINTARELKNKSLADLVLLSAFNHFNENDFLYLFFLGIIQDDLNSGELVDYSHSHILFTFFHNMHYSGFFSNDFEYKIEVLRVNFLGERERVYPEIPPELN